MRRSTWLAAVVVAGSLVAGGPVQAGETPDPNLGDTILGTVDGIRYARAAEPYDSLNNDYAETSAGCGPQAFKVVGGGAVAGDALLAWQQSQSFVDYTDADSNADDGFRASGFGPAGKTQTVFAICMRDTPVKVVTEELPDQPTSRRTGTSSCGGSKWHVASGAVHIGTTNSWTSSSRPKDGGDGDAAPDDGWTGVAYDTIGGIGGASVSVACIKGRPMHYVNGRKVSIPAGASRVRKSACAANEHVIGGGLRLTGAADEVRMVSSATYDGKDADTIPDDGWRVRATNLAGASKELTPYAVCVR